MTARPLTSLLVYLVVALVAMALAPACDTSGANATCGVQGATQLCLCGGAVEGGQTCEADGTWSTCDCEAVDTGDGGTGAGSDTPDDSLDAPCDVLLGDPDDPDATWFGAIVPLTGGLGEFGVGMKNGIELALADHAGPPFAVRLCDTGTTAEGTIAAAEALVQAQVPAIIGPATSGGLVEVFESILHPADVLLISPSATSPTITDLADDGLVWRVAPSDALQGTAIAEYLLQTDAEKVAIVFRSDPYGWGIRDAIVDTLCLPDSSPCGPVFLMTWARDAEAAADVEAVAEFAPDVTVVIDFGQEAVEILGGLSDHGVERVIVTDAVLGADLDQLSPETACRLTVFGMAPPEGADWEAFSATYSAAFGEPAPTFAPNAYDAMTLLLAAATSGASDGGALAAALADVAATTTGGASGPQTFDVASGDVFMAVGASRLDVASGELVSLGVALEADGSPAAFDDAHASGASCP